MMEPSRLVVQVRVAASWERTCVRDRKNTGCTNNRLEGNARK